MKVWSGIPVHIGAYLAKANRSRQPPDLSLLIRHENSRT